MTLFVTHRDIANRLRAYPDRPWSEIVSNPDEIRVLCREGDARQVSEMLPVALGSAWNARERSVRLEGRERTICVQIEESDEAPAPPVTRPLWKSATRIDPRSFESGCRVASFHSYKGGVGRTTTLLATLSSLLRRASTQSRVLVVDADIEAPGLTWLLRRTDVERISLLDYLALVHDSDDWENEAVPIIAANVQSYPVAVDLPDAGRREFLFLPAIRGIDDSDPGLLIGGSELFSPPTIPEQVVRRKGRAFVVGDAIHALGNALNVELVLVDARAGVSEFASPLFLDPRIESIAITSCDEQSVAGTFLALRCAADRGVRLSRLVVSMVPPGDAGTLAYDRATKRLLDPLLVGGDSCGDPPSEDARIELLRADFAQELIAGDSFENLLGVRIPGTVLGKEVGVMLANGLSPVRVSTHPSQGASGPFSLRRFVEFTKQLEYAERNAQAGLLSTPALRALTNLGPSQLPNRVVLGAKGSGKTFAWAQMVLAGDFCTFSRMVRKASTAASAPIVSLLESEDLSDEIVQKARDHEQSIGITGIPPLEAVTRLERDEGARDAVGQWVTIIRARLGLPTNSEPTIPLLMSQVRERFRRIVLVTDGLERFFQSIGISHSEHRSRLLRALLQDVPNLLRQDPMCPLGLVTFVRRDLAAAVITQNFGQFESRYDETALRWSPLEAIRLAAWLLAEAGWEPAKTIDPNDSSQEKLEEILQDFWNEKLGGERDARTWRWILSALSDFNAVVQARDLVRFLRAAAEQHKGPNLPLAASALRTALPEVAEKKVQELEREIPALVDVFKRLRQVPQEKKVVPFVPSELGISPEEVAFLERVGLLIRPDAPADNAYLQEVVRHGLGFRLGRRGRARIVSLYNKAVRRMS